MPKMTVDAVKPETKKHPSAQGLYTPFNNAKGWQAAYKEITYSIP